MTRTYITEFPDFHLDVQLPAGFEDCSWHNDSCPSWHNAALGLHLFIDYASPAHREIPEAPRFSLSLTYDNGEIGELAKASDDYGDILAYITAFKRRVQRFTLADVPPIALKTPAGVGAWLLALQAKGMLWHMDDSPLDIEGFEAIAPKLAALQAEAWRICKPLKANIWGLPVWETIFDIADKEVKSCK